MKECPRCGLINPESTQRCDCGYGFAKGLQLETLGKYLDDTMPSEKGRVVKAKRPYPGFFQAIWLIVLVFIVQLIAYAFAGGFSPHAQLESPRFAICVLISFGLVIAYGLRKTKARFSEVFPLVHVRWFVYLPMALCLLGMIAILRNEVNLVYTLYPPPIDVRQMVPDMIHTGGYWNAFFQLVVMAPLTEEFLFRGLILRGFLKRYGTVWAVVLSAVLWGASHGDLWQFAYVVPLGLLLGWWAVETESLVPCLFGHAFLSSVALVEFVTDRRWAEAHPAKMLHVVHYVPAWFVLIGGAIFGAGIFVLARYFHRYPLAAVGLQG